MLYIHTWRTLLIIKPTKRTNSSNLFWNKTLHVSSVHHQEFFTVHTAKVQVIQVCWQVASRIRKEHQQTHKTYTIALCTVKNSWWWTDELSETCRILFQNKFEKLVHLGGFIIRIYHDARSHERQTDGLLTIKRYYTIKLTVQEPRGRHGAKSGRGSETNIQINF